MNGSSGCARHAKVGLGIPTWEGRAGCQAQTASKEMYNEHGMAYIDVFLQSMLFLASLCKHARAYTSMAWPHLVNVTSSNAAEHQK
jgi:hypothetical protein